MKKQSWNAYTLQKWKIRTQRNLSKRAQIVSFTKTLFNKEIEHLITIST